MSITFCGAETRFTPTAYAALEARRDLDDPQPNDLACHLPESRPHGTHACCYAVVKGGADELWAFWTDDDRTPEVSKRGNCRRDPEECSLWSGHPGDCLPAEYPAT